MISIPELTINWHIIEACNYDCYFCYAKYAQRSVFGRDYAAIMHELVALKGKKIEFLNTSALAENVRLNFAGGEPFLEKRLGAALSLAFRLGLRPSFISNGSLIEDDFIREFGPMISVAGFSVDSFDAGLNQRIGRQDNRGRQVDLTRLSQMFALFREVSPSTRLKINTVVCGENADEDMNGPLRELQPHRWKVLRVIPIHGAEQRAITDDRFQAFLARHQAVNGERIPEDNGDMHRSYLMLNPEGRFYQRIGSDYLSSEPVVQVGAATALRRVEFDVETYASRY